MQTTNGFDVNRGLGNTFSLELNLEEEKVHHKWKIPFNEMCISQRTKTSGCFENCTINLLVAHGTAVRAERADILTFSDRMIRPLFRSFSRNCKA